jgi:hypothetical protein
MLACAPSSSRLEDATIVNGDEAVAAAIVLIAS